MDRLMAGVGRCDITPAPGTPQGGWGAPNPHVRTGAVPLARFSARDFAGALLSASIMWTQKRLPVLNADFFGDEEARGTPLEPRRKKSGNPPGGRSEVERVNSFCRRPYVKAVACVGRAKTAQTFCTRAMASGRAQKRKRSLQRKRLIRPARCTSRSRYFLKRALRSSDEKHSPLMALARL
jgi:hypothetical protein